MARTLFAEESIVGAEFIPSLAQSPYQAWHSAKITK
jgi:hypothetical protein